MIKKSLLYFLVIFISAKLFAQDAEVPVDMQMAIFVKIISLEKVLSQKIQDKKNIKILILFQNKFRQSLNERNKIEEYFDNLKDKTYIISDLIFNEEHNIKNFISENKIDIIIVTSLRAVDMTHISEYSKSTQVLTFTTSPTQVEKGLSFGIELVKDRPQILINLEQSKSEGATFSSHLLKMARIIYK